MFYFNELERLHEMMTENNDTRAVFSFTYNSKQLSCIFIIDVNPYMLILAPLGADFAINISINEDFTANTYINNHFRELINFLELKYDPENKFRPLTLFEVINSNIPDDNYQQTNYTTIIRTASLAQDIEEADKIYFCGFRNNGKNETVSNRNYIKTKVAFGKLIADNLRKANVSTRWTSQRNEEDIYLINRYLERIDRQR